MPFSIRLTEEEKALAESYAKLHSMSVGEAFKRALFERIEDEYDIAVADEAYEEYLKSGKKAGLFPSCGRKQIYDVQCGNYRKIRPRIQKTRQIYAADDQKMD